MTISASREGENIKLHYTYGPATVDISEHAGDMKHVHAQIGDLLGRDPETRAREGYERYRQHTGGVSKFTGDRLPAFDEQDDEIKGHWVAAFTE